MKSLINMRAGAMMLMLILLSGTSAWADVDDYILSVRNVSHTTNTIDFDLYLLDTDNAQALEFAALQMGLLLNSSIYGTGTLTVNYSNAGSGLDGDQQFVGSADVVGSLAGYPGQTLIRLMPNSIPPVPPGAGSGTVISAIGNGTFLTHFTITSSVSFTPNTRPDMIFCASSDVSPLYPTVVSAYIDGDATPLTVTPGVDAIVDGNPLLNATLPTLFNVTGAGDYCEGGAGLPVGLDGSEINTTYILYRGLDEVSSIPGTGSALSFGIQTEGTYTIYATNDAGSIQMTGEAVITAVINTVGAASSTPTVCINTALTSITHITTGATGIGLATGLPAGVTAAWASNTITISGTPTESGTFNYTIPLTGGCGSVNATGTINVNALPVTSVITGSATPACSATGVPYSVTSTTGSTYTWTVPDGATVATGHGTNSITVNFGTTNGNISVTERNAAGCNGTTQTLTITLQGCGLDANFEGTPLTICVGSSVAFTNTSTGTTGSTTYSWNFGSGATPASITGIGPHAVTYSTTGSKTVSLTITEGASNTETKDDYITVNPINTITLTSGVGTNNQTVCVNTPITTITYSTTSATGATFTGLPTGVTGSWSSDVVTISGTPSTSGTFNYTVTLTGGCGTVTANGTLTVNICTRTLNLSSVFLEGLYNGGGTMRQAWGETGAQWPEGIADHITVELHDAGNYMTIIHTVPDVDLTTTGTAVITIPAEHSASYYITIKHRNSIETTTAAAVSFSGTTISYSYNLLSAVYGGNMGLSGDGRFLIFSGDINQDRYVDTQDYLGVDNDSYNYASGYLVTDVDGNGMVDTNDYLPIDNNNYNYVGAILP